MVKRSRGSYFRSSLVGCIVAAVMCSQGDTLGYVFAFVFTLAAIVDWRKYWSMASVQE